MALDVCVTCGREVGHLWKPFVAALQALSPSASMDEQAIRAIRLKSRCCAGMLTQHSNLLHYHILREVHNNAANSTPTVDKSSSSSSSSETFAQTDMAGAETLTGCPRFTEERKDKRDTPG